MASEEEEQHIIFVLREQVPSFVTYMLPTSTVIAQVIPLGVPPLSATLWDKSPILGRYGTIYTMQRSLHSGGGGKL